MMETTSIPDEIIYDIFSWLPIKSLMRFKCISKFYISLLSDSCFIDIQQYHSIYRPDKTKFLIHSRDKEFYYAIDVEVEHRKASVIRVGKLRGFLINPKFGYAKGLLGLWWSTSPLPPVIYNPITRKARYLPRLDFPDKTTEYYYSLGFDHDIRKYKVFVVTHSSLPLRYWVYTLVTGDSWREIKSTVKFFPLLKGGVCINGAIYIFGFYNKNFCVVEFNLRTENLRIILWWKDLKYDPEGWFYNLIELEGKLAVIDRWTKGEMDLWILERSESSEEWVKHAIAFPSQLSDSLRSCFCSSTPDGEIVFITNSPLGSNWISFYNWKKKIWRPSKIETTELGKDVETIGICSYADSLLSLHFAESLL